MKSSEKVVAYFYDEEIGNFNYGGGNPMRPHRVRLTHTLINGYNLAPKLLVHRPQPRTYQELTEFHADEYVDFLRSVTPNNQEEYMAQLRRFNLGIPGEADCPVFDGLFQYCQMYSGGSVDGAALLSQGKADIALNWAGGMHHAKKAEASGFCYINDIVLAILELLKVYQRVLYVDIDIHHGDGVEEAFYLTDRVMTVSFHKYGDFFPGTGHVEDVGYQKGKHYTVNVPLHEGMDDESYRFMFEPIMQKVMEVYQPGAVVVCAGADSLSGDRLGCFNLSLEGHSNCLEFLARFNVPMLVLGGGGYTMRNVSRCWCYETGRLMGQDLPDLIPDAAQHDFNYFMDTARLRIAVSNMKNSNTREELERIKTEVLANLSKLPAAPGVGIKHMPAPRKIADLPEEEMDERGGGKAHDDWRHVKTGDESDEEDVKPGLKREHDHREGTPGSSAPPPIKPGSAGRGEQDGGQDVAIKEEPMAEDAPIKAEEPDAGALPEQAADTDMADGSAPPREQTPEDGTAAGAGSQDVAMEELTMSVLPMATEPSVAGVPRPAQPSAPSPSPSPTPSSVAPTSPSPIKVEQPGSSQVEEERKTTVPAAGPSLQQDSLLPPGFSYPPGTVTSTDDLKLPPGFSSPSPQSRPPPPPPPPPPAQAAPDGSGQGA